MAANDKEPNIIIEKKYGYEPATIESEEQTRCLVTDERPYWSQTPPRNAQKTTAPRRFGKTLTVYTMKAFFQGKKDLFKGLAIEKLASDAGYDWAEFPVNHLDITRVDDFTSKESTARGLKRIMARAAALNEVEIPEDTFGGMFQRLIGALKKKTGKDVVVLIDEYDKPTLETMRTPIVIGAVNICCGIYSTVKSFEADEHFNSGYRLSNYWCDTDNPKFLIERLKNSPFTLDKYARGGVSPQPYRSVDIKEVNQLRLAIESG